MGNYYKINGILDSQNGWFQLDKTILEIREDIEASNGTLIPLIVLAGTTEWVPEGSDSPVQVSFCETLVPGTIYPYDNHWGEDEPQWIPSDVSFVSTIFGYDDWVITEDGRLMSFDAYIEEYYPSENGGGGE